MELTRRDALAALAAAGVAAESALAGCATDGDGPDEVTGTAPDPITDRQLSVLTATAAVVYPGEVENVDSFVEEFVTGRASAKPDHARGVADAADYVAEWTDAWYDSGYVDLAPTERESALDRMGVREADPAPDGTDAQRVRYYVVNELLFALYASPTGGELVGIENPQGHPGGIESYRRGPG
jgi:hypothetical protein